MRNFTFFDTGTGDVLVDGNLLAAMLAEATTPADGTFADLAASGDLDVTGDGAIGGDLDLTGDGTVGGDLDVTGVLAVTGTATAANARLGTGTKTATAIAGAATLNKPAGAVTSEALTTAAGADYVLTLTDSDIAAGDQVFASVKLGSATTGVPAVATVTESNGQVVIVIQNIHASAALNGTIKISFVVFKN